MPQQVEAREVQDEVADAAGEVVADAAGEVEAHEAEDEVADAAGASSGQPAGRRLPNAPAAERRRKEMPPMFQNSKLKPSTCA